MPTVTLTGIQGTMKYIFDPYSGGVREGTGGHTIPVNQWCEPVYTPHIKKESYPILEKRSVVLQRAVSWLDVLWDSRSDTQTASYKIAVRLFDRTTPRRRGHSRLIHWP